MASLKEIKARITSVQSTLKITSAMKMVASAKLHRVQSVAAALAEYEKRLMNIASALCNDPDAVAASPLAATRETTHRAVVIAFSSDGSLCGAFNANAIRAMIQQINTLREEKFSEITVYPVGEKIALAAHKAGYDVCDDFRHIVGGSSYNQAASLAQRLMDQYIAGSVDRVCLVYNHFHSMGKQISQQEIFLPADFSTVRNAAMTSTSEPKQTQSNYIYEPDAGELLTQLLPYTLRTRLYEVLLDSNTAEHAARMIAMQTATDNAQELLGELTLTYNKRRQQAITDELADITQVE